MQLCASKTMKMKESKSIRDLSTHNKREYITTIPKRGEFIVPRSCRTWGVLLPRHNSQGLMDSQGV